MIKQSRDADLDSGLSASFNRSQSPEEQLKQSLENQIVVFVGPPASGKGTQGQNLSKATGIPTISMGDLLRKEINAGSEVGKKVEALVAAGDLVPDDLIISVVEDNLVPELAKGSLILDGFPRTVEQKEALDKILADAGLPAPIIVELSVPDDQVLIDRMQGRGRADDTFDVFQNRLKVYRNETEPMIDAYRGEGRTVSVDGDLPISDIAVEVIDSLLEKLDQ